MDLFIFLANDKICDVSGMHCLAKYKGIINRKMLWLLDIYVDFRGVYNFEETM